MSEVGALIINLQAQTAQFRADMGKVKQDLDDLKDKSDGAGRVMGSSMTMSRESVMLLGDEIGVHLPRALTMYISRLPGVATAMQAAFPILGIVALIEIIDKLIEHHEALAKAIRQAGEEAVNSAVKQADQTKALELTNLKLDDQIAKLEHKPSHNYLKEAMIETSEEIDKLAASFASDFDKMGEKVQEQLGLWSQLKRYASDMFHMGAIAGATVASVQ